MLVISTTTTIITTTTQSIQLKEEIIATHLVKLSKPLQLVPSNHIGQFLSEGHISHIRKNLGRGNSVPVWTRFKKQVPFKTHWNYDLTELPKGKLSKQKVSITWEPNG